MINTKEELFQKIEIVEQKLSGDKERLQALAYLRKRIDKGIKQYGSPLSVEIVDTLLASIQRDKIPYKEKADEEKYEEVKQCPICFKSTKRGFCKHYIGSGYNYYESQEDFSTNLDFHEKADQLCCLIQSLKGKLNEAFINKAPKDLREIIRWVRENGFYGYYFWTRHEGVESYEYESGGGPGNTFGCRDYFHPEPKTLAREIKEEAERGIVWLQEHRLAHKKSKS